MAPLLEAITQELLDDAFENQARSKSQGLLSEA